MKTKRDYQSKDKKEELTTYKSIGFGRQMKTRSQRNRVEKNGVHLVVGGEAIGRPYLQVPKQRYREIRFEVTKEFLLRAKKMKLEISIDRFLQQMHSQIESTVYDRLHEEQVRTATVDGAFLHHHNRGLTVEEKKRFAETEQMGNGEGRSKSSTHRSALIDGVLTKVSKRQLHNPGRYQTAWAETVGIEAAQQSWLERLDAVQGIAYFRCCNSVLSYQLQRKPELPKKLGQLLKVTLRQFRVCH